MKRIYLLLFVTLLFFGFTNALGLADDEDGMSPADVSKKLQEVNAKPPAEISALIPTGTIKTNLVFGPDYGTRSYVRVEFTSEILNKDYHLHDRARLDLRCNVVDPNSQMAKMLYIQAYQAEQQDNCEKMRETLKGEASPLVKWEEIKNQYGTLFAQTVKYVEMGELGKNEKPHEEYYYNCTYIGRVGGAFFEFTIQSLPLTSKANVTQWFGDLVTKLGKLNVVKLCNY